MLRQHSQQGRTAAPGPPIYPRHHPGAKQCHGPSTLSGPKVDADKGTASASSSSSCSGDSANGVHLLGSSWNNKLYHPKKQNHKRGSACSSAHKSPLSGGPLRPSISQRKLNLTKINSTPSPVLSRSMANCGATWINPTLRRANTISRAPGRATQCWSCWPLLWSSIQPQLSWLVLGGLCTGCRPQCCSKLCLPVHPS